MSGKQQVEVQKVQNSAKKSMLQPARPLCCRVVNLVDAPAACSMETKWSKEVRFGEKEAGIRDFSTLAL